MFREMRRNKQLLSMEDTAAVMDRCTNGVMACLGDEDYPYAVPLSYVYFNDKIYFHSAKAGHKIDAIMKNPKVSFSVIDEDTIVSEKYTSYFRSVIAFGKARIAEGDERMEAFRALVENTREISRRRQNIRRSRAAHKLSLLRLMSCTSPARKQLNMSRRKTNSRTGLLIRLRAFGRKNYEMDFFIAGRRL